MSACALCASKEESVLWRDERCRVIDVGDPDYPGYCRVIWNEHVREVSDLAVDDRHHMLDVVNAVEEAVRTVMCPDKINLAAFGNQVPHLHWHVIPRFSDDVHFPDAIWAARRRDGRARPCDRAALVRELKRRLTE